MDAEPQVHWDKVWLKCTTTENLLSSDYHHFLGGSVYRSCRDGDLDMGTKGSSVIVKGA